MESRNMKYYHISQKPYCCVPACVQMILNRRKLPLIDQAEIAYDLGVVLPPEDRHSLPRSHKGRRPKAGWGTRINLKKYCLAVFFKRRGYFLKETFYSAKKFRTEKQFKEFLSDNVSKGNDLLVCFNYPFLHRLKGKWGHASLIEKLEKEYAILCDPQQKYKKTRKVLMNDLLLALKNHNHGGIWVIKEKPAAAKIKKDSQIIKSK